MLGMSSPSRYTLEDLGLNLDNEEDNDFCRGYGANTNLNDEAYFGGVNFETGQADDDDDGENDHVPEMSTDFYKNVDSFLSRPPPTLKGSSSAPKKSKGDKEKDSSSKVPMFPSINPKQQENRMYLPPPPVAAEAEVPKKKKKSKESKGNVEPAAKKQLDSALLSEAFAYTDKLLREAVLEEQLQQQQQMMQFNTKAAAPNGNRAHSTGTIGVEYGKPQKSDSSSNVNVLRKLKSDRQKGYLGSGAAAAGGKSSNGGSSSNAKPADFNVASGEGDFVDSRRNMVDFDELVANFESGATLQKLRKELEESKRSMANSQNYLRNMTKDMIYK